MNRKPDDSEPAPKKKRGPYMRWLLDPSVPVPPSTLHSRVKTAARAAESTAATCSASHQESDHQDNEANSQDTQCHVENEQLMDAPQEKEAPLQQPQIHNSQDAQAAITNREDFLKKHHLKDKIPSKSSLSKLDILIMILHLAVRHCNTQHFVEDQIKFVNCLFGETVVDTSYYIYKTLFKPFVQIIKHYVCIDCDEYLGRDEDFLQPTCPQCRFVSEKLSDNFVVCVDCCCYVGTLEDFNGREHLECQKCNQNIFSTSKVPESSAVCANCKFYMVSRKDCLKRVKTCECPKCLKRIDVKSVSSGNYFISFSLREQLQELLLKPGLQFVDRVDRDPSVIRDVCDGEFYRKLMEPGYPLANEYALTITFNTDGVEVHESTQNSLWPIWFYVNEIIPEQRFNQQNRLLGGLWFGKSAPKMSLFLQPFAKEIVQLSANGVNRVLPNGSHVKCPVYPLLCSLDSVAKPKVLCQKQFNGKMGCLYCLHPNDTTVVTVKNQRFYDQEQTYALRSDEDVMRDMLKADSLQRQGLLKTGSVNGFLGLSVLLTFTDLLDFLNCNTYSITFGTVIDYLHAVLEGVSGDLFNIIRNLLTAEQLSLLNERIVKVTPPQGMTRRPRSFDHMTKWKAKEYRAMALYYILPCVEGLLADKYFENLKLFVKALHILLSDSITHTQLQEASLCMDRFCVGFQRLYGIVNTSYNLHLCRHLSELVKRYGALWCYSNFVFESGNGYLVNLVRGSKSVISEIASKHTTIETASQFIIRDYISCEALKFCQEILKCQYPRKSEGLKNSAAAGLSMSIGTLTEGEAVILRDNNVDLLDNNSVMYYNRVVRDGIIFCSKSYKKTKVYDDSCVMLKDGGLRCY